MNPIANIGIFMGLTEGLGPAEKRRIAARATLISFLIVLVLAFAGKLLFVKVFGLTLPSLRITGGIVIFLVGIELLRGPHSKASEPDDGGIGLAISPLATPILAGPGTIVTAASFVAEGSMEQDIATVGAFALICALTFWMFIAGEKLVQLLGKDVINVISRLMGLILATLGVHMLTIGIYGSVAEGIRFIAEHP
jgi:multiple antibiotic resistance protein